MYNLQTPKMFLLAEIKDTNLQHPFIQMCLLIWNFSLSVCPHLGDPMDGGQVNLQTLKISDNIKYSFDCVWQIKSPQKKGTFGVYARVVNMNLQHGKYIVFTSIHIINNF